MTSFQYPNLTIVEDDDAVATKIAQLRQAIIATLPGQEISSITANDIQSAIQRQYNTCIHLQHILQYGSTYLLLIESASTYNLMLATGYLSMLPHGLNLVPWEPEYGSSKVPAYSQPTDLFNFDYNTIAKKARQPSTRVQIEISGIPPHLCTDNTVRTLLMNLCGVEHITFSQVINKYWVEANNILPSNNPTSSSYRS